MLKVIVAMMGVIYLLFVFFALVFIGKRHSLIPEEGFSLSWIDLSLILQNGLFPLVLMLVLGLILVMGIGFSKKGD